MLGDLHYFQNIKAVDFPMCKKSAHFLWSFSADFGCRRSWGRVL